VPDFFLEIGDQVFTFRRSNDGEDQTPARPVSNQKRQAYRASIEFPVIYVVDGRPGTRTASANDLSVGGLRLLGDEDFTKETIIDFRFTLPTAAVGNVYLEKEIQERSAFGPRTRRVKVPPTPFEPMEIAGKIVIAFYNLRTGKFAHGVRFLHVPQRTEDELQRFIHLYQLKQLRDRADREV
jgi:c-di-GMP-binding flagellar brake protein YcgR